MKKALNIGDPRKTIAIMLVGAIMGALLVGPIATFADDEDDDNRREITTTIPNFMLLDRDGNALEFTLIENGVGKVLTLVEKGPGPDYLNPPNNDDDD